MLSLAQVWRGLDPTAVEHAISRFETAEVPEGTRLAEEGESRDALYFLQEGVVAVESGGFRVTELGPGSFFGEIALFGHGQRTATVVAVTPLRVRRLRRSEYEVLRAAHNVVAYEIERRACRTLAARTIELSREIAELAKDSPLVEILPGGVAVGMPLPSTPQSVAAKLAGVPGFDEAAELLSTLAPELQVRAFRSGEKLSSAGRPPGAFVLVAAGEIDQIAAVEPTRGVRTGTWGPGSMAAIAGLVLDAPMPGFAIANTGVTAFVAPHASFQRWFLGDTDRGSVFRTAVIRELANQVTNANAVSSMLRLLAPRAP